MQFDGIAESSYRSFLQYYQAALGSHLSKPQYVYLFFIFQFTLVLLYICVFFFQTTSLKTYKVLIPICGHLT